MIKIKVYLLYFISISYLILAYRYMPVDKDYKFEEVLTFLSIVLGFTFTGMTLISGSEFSKKLYKLESKSNNSLTQLHELVGIYYFNAKLFIVNSVLIILFELFNKNLMLVEFIIFKIDFYKLCYISIVYLTLINFYNFYLLIKLFKNLVIQSVT